MVLAREDQAPVVSGSGRLLFSGGLWCVGVDGLAEVTGSLRRRFFRGSGGPQSRYEVEARSVRSPADDQASDPGGR